MNRIALVTTLASGKEADVRQAQTSMPTDKLRQSGIRGLPLVGRAGHDGHRPGRQRQEHAGRHPQPLIARG
jgi:hypothetical protein